MKNGTARIASLIQLYETIPEYERLIVDVLRQIIKENLPVTGKEKISYNLSSTAKKAFA